MNKGISISVFDTVGSPLCVASNDGQKVYSRVAEAMKQGYSIALSFRNVSTLTLAFLNTAIGQLYGKFDEKQIRVLLTVEDMESDDVFLLERVVETAKQYFRDPQRFDDVVREVIEDDEENA